MLGIWIGGVFLNFGFGLREKKLGIWIGGGILEVRIWT